MVYTITPPATTGHLIIFKEKNQVDIMSHIYYNANKTKEIL